MTIRALIVEDDPASNKMLQKLVVNRIKEDIDIVCCSNGAEGLYHYLRQPTFDLVLLDIMMPEVGGMDFLRVLESLWSRKLLPQNPNIIVETAVKDYQQLSDITNLLTVFAVHQKPINVATLGETITQVLETRKLDDGKLEEKSIQPTRSHR